MRASIVAACLLAAVGTMASLASCLAASDDNAIAAVKRLLRDPDSAKFGEMRPVTGVGNNGKPTDVICGTFNAKTFSGGYLGVRGFVYIPLADTALIDFSPLISEDPVSQVVGTATVRRWCS